jgi:DNA-binding transcriptional ArsR family regulator
MRTLTRIFKALSDSNRLRIIKMLEQGPLCVCEITAVLNLASSTVSKHLSILRDAELILDEKRGKWVHYRLNQSKTETYVNELLPLLAGWLPDDQIVKRDAWNIDKVDRQVLQQH